MTIPSTHEITDLLLAWSDDGKKFLVIRQLEDASMRPLTGGQNWTELLKK